jgi:hypothetical protein
MHRSSSLSPELQAAASAKVSREALRGIVEIAGMVYAALDAQRLPAHSQDVIGALCEDPLGWAVVNVAKVPYAYVRAPLTSDGARITTVDLRRIQPSSQRPPGIHCAAWPKVYAAAKHYHELHPGESKA